MAALPRRSLRLSADLPALLVVSIRIPNESIALHTAQAFAEPGIVVGAWGIGPEPEQCGLPLVERLVAKDDFRKM